MIRLREHRAEVRVHQGTSSSFVRLLPTNNQQTTGAVEGPLIGFATGLIGGPIPAAVGTIISIGIGKASGSGP